MTDKEKEYVEELLKNGSTIRLKDIAYKEGQPPEEDEDPDEDCCGDCCWFYGEETSGWGLCACQHGDCDPMHCSDMCEDDFVSRKEMRHHMAVLLQANRWTFNNNGVYRRMPKSSDVEKAQAFAFRYMKVFGNL